MNAPGLTRKDKLRARDKGLCWLCQKPMDFGAIPNSARAPTEEHLIPTCRKGPDTLDNLVLCHPACNIELRDRPLAEKIRMREKHLKERWLQDLLKRVIPTLRDQSST